MPTRARVEYALPTHFDAWNARDCARWIANGHPDVVMQDSVGGPEKKGMAAVEPSWDRSFQPGDDGRIERVQTDFSPPEGRTLDPYSCRRPEAPSGGTNDHARRTR